MPTKVLITGGYGFLGQHVLKKFQTPEYIPTVFHSRDWDLRSDSSTSHLFKTAKPDIVIHLAAECGGIGANQSYPADFAQNNLQMGINVLEQSHFYGVKKVVLLSTCCEYPKHCPVPFKEENIYNGYPEETNAPYAMAKKMIRILGESYRKQYGLNVISLIPANLYGPGDHFNLKDSHVIPALIRKFVEAKETGASEVVLWGSGEVTREFLYVEDCARAIRMATEHYDEAAPLNIGNGWEIQIKQLAYFIRSLVECKADIRWDTSKPDGQPKRRLDVTKAFEKLGFKAFGNQLEPDMLRTITWYLENRETANG